MEKDRVACEITISMLNGILRLNVWAIFINRLHCFLLHEEGRYLVSDNCDTCPKWYQV